MEALPDELVEAILLRSPPDDPARLARAALVCKRWCRLVSGRGFRRRLRQFHRTAPMLGLLHTWDEEFLFVPTSSFRPPHEGKRFRCVVDVRHGHVLLHGIGRRPGGTLGPLFAVWDPITGHQTVLPTPIEYLKLLPRWCAGPSGEYLQLLPNRWSAAVLCAAAGDDTCDHLDCHRGPFHVVIVCCDSKQAHACVYSSVTGAWRQPVSSRLLQLHHGSCLGRDPASAFLCDALFFKFGTDHQLLRYDLASEEMSVIDPPDALQEMSAIDPADAFSGQCSWCITTEDGRRLGFAAVEGNKLYLWSREASSHGGDWTEARVIELEKLLPVVESVDDDVVDFSIPLHVVGFADGVGIFIVDTSGKLFTVDLKSSLVKEVCDVNDDIGGIPDNIFPYMIFLTPAPGGTL